MPSTASDGTAAIPVTAAIPAAFPVPLMLPATPRSASVARRVLRDALQPVLPDEVLADVELLSTELVANAAAASADQCIVAVTAPEPEVVRVSVSDLNPQPPSVYAAEPFAEHGRGMRLVNLLSWRWGIEPNEPQGKTVWFEVRAITP